MAWGESQDMSPPGENIKCLYTTCSVPCTAVAAAHRNLVLWGFFLCKVPRGDQGLQDLKNKIPTSHGFLSKLFDEIHFCPLFLKLQMFVVPN